MRYKERILPELLEGIKPQKLNYPASSLGSNTKVLALGKSAPAVVDALRFHFQKDFESLIITKVGVETHGLECLFGEHPIPNESSFENFKKMITWIQKDQKNLLVIVTGGASAVVEMIPSSFSRKQFLELTKNLLNIGATIEETNQIRKSLSLIKNGGLCTFLEGRGLETWLMVDVPVEDLSLVGSGPTLYTRVEREKLRAVSQKYFEGELLSSYHHFLDSGFEELDRKKKKASCDFAPKVLLDYSCLLNRAKNLGIHFVESPLNMSLKEGMDFLLGLSGWHLSGGELPVQVEGGGSGGRNSHFVLAMAHQVFELNRLKLNEEELSKVFISSLATDGDDGNSGAAGGWMNYTTYKVAKDLGLDLFDFLERNDSATFLQKLGVQYLTGPTGINIMDLRLVYLKA